MIFWFSRLSLSCKTKTRRSLVISPRRAKRSGIFWRIRSSSRPSDLLEERMNARTQGWAAILSTIALSARAAQAGVDAALLKDLTAVIALQRLPCEQFVSATKQGDNDYITTCKNGSRYQVFINEGRVVVQKQ